jgi:hypothetical protein
MFDGIRITSERLISASGLAIVGLILKNTRLKKRLNASKLKDNAMPQIKNGDVANAYIGLLCQGKNDFEAIREMDADPEFYKLALDLDAIPSSETLRQRMDLVNESWRNIILEENVRMLLALHAVFTPCFGIKYIPLDVDVGPFDNSNTKKQGIGWTYKKFDGYAPIFAYLGDEGYLVNLELRNGSDHCQKNTVVFLKETLLKAHQLTAAPILVRLDSGNDAEDNLILFYQPETHCEFIIKRNLRRESIEGWWELAKKEGTLFQPREGKKVYIGSTYREILGLERKVRIVFEVIERTSKADGQLLLVPDLEVNTWWTSLKEPEKTIIELYHDHGQSEQYHSELKTDMDLERLPSGKFQTNQLVLELALLAYNILRLIGQQSLKKNDAPMRREAGRRRIRTVIQNMVLMASRVVSHARKKYLNLGCSNAWIPVFKRIYEAFE